MRCEVLAVREAKSGVRIAHVRVQGMIGELPCDGAVGVGAAAVKVRLSLHQGRIIANARVVGDSDVLPVGPSVVAVIFFGVEKEI